MKRRFALLVVSIALISGACAAAEAPTLEQTVERAAAAMPAGGIVAAEINGAEVRFVTRGNLGVPAGVAPERVIFEIGSITKVFTTLLLAQTIQEGKARLADPISKFFPPEIPLSADAAKINLWQLATHSSGLPRMPTNFSPRNPKDPYADYDTKLLYAFLRDYTAASRGPSFPAEYSNLGLGLLGHILERIHQKPWAQLVAERITSPAGMTDTGVALNADQTKRLAPPHSGSQAVSPWTLDAMAGAGALRSTAADLSKLAQVLMSKEETPLRRAWDLVRQPRTKLGNDQLGLAIMVEQPTDGPTSYHHGGGTGGTRSYLEFTPDTQRGVVILINNDTVEPEEVAAKLRPPPPPPKVAPVEQPLAPEKRGEFVGVYVANEKAKFTVLFGPGGELYAKLTGRPLRKLLFAGNDRFFNSATDAQLQFQRDAAGKITSLTLHQRGAELAAPRTEEKAPAIQFPTEAELTPFAGSYELQPGVVFDVRAAGDQLYAKLTGQPEFPIFKTGENEFIYDVVVASLTFERDAAGKVVALTLHQNGQNPRAKRVK